jgi:hypothetical protein
VDRGRERAAIARHNEQAKGEKRFSTDASAYSPVTLASASCCRFTESIH